MKKQKIWSRLMIGSLLVLILVIGGTAVFAQSQDDPNVTPPAEEGGTDRTLPVFPNPFSRDARPHFDGRPGKGPADDYLADALGITSEELQAARQAAHAAALEQAVADGLLTQEQADQLSQFGGRFMRGGHFLALDDMEELLAEELDISVEALQAAQDEAQTAQLAQMVEDGVLTPEQADLIAAHRAINSYIDFDALREAQQAAFETAVQQALEDGAITQDQADQILSGANSFGPRGFSMPGAPGGRGGHGHGGMRGDGRFPSFPGSAAPSSTANSDA